MGAQKKVNIKVMHNELWSGTESEEELPRVGDLVSGRRKFSLCRFSLIEGSLSTQS